MSKLYSLTDITNALGGLVIGDANTLISRVSSLANAKSGDISFMSDAKYKKALEACKASAYVLREKDAGLTSAPCISTDNPYAYFAKLSAFLNPTAIPALGIATSAVVDKTASIPSSCSILPMVVKIGRAHV